MRTQDAEDIKSAQFYVQQHLSEEAGGDRRRYDYNNMLQGVSYLLAKLDPAKKDQWSRPIRETMTTWLRGQDNITYTEQVRDMRASCEPHAESLGWIRAHWVGGPADLVGSCLSTGRSNHL